MQFILEKGTTEQAINHKGADHLEESSYKTDILVN